MIKYVLFGAAVMLDVVASIKIVKSYVKFNKTLKEINAFELRREANRITEETEIRKA